jgi:hypothetical protein
MDKPIYLYHGSSYKIAGPLRPVLKAATEDHVHDRPAVFATERIDLAAMFMSPADILLSIGFEQDIAFICIWGDPQEFKDSEAYVYVFSSEFFEKVGKEYEWQSFESVMPVEVREFPSLISGMMECGVQVYFIQDDIVMDRIVADKNNRTPILKELVSENQKKGVNIRKFT